MNICERCNFVHDSNSRCIKDLMDDFHKAADSYHETMTEQKAMIEEYVNDLKTKLSECSHSANPADGCSCMNIEEHLDFITSNTDEFSHGICPHLPDDPDVTKCHVCGFEVKED